MSEVVAILTRAREMVVREGWVQHVGRDHLGRRCVGQAIQDAWFEAIGMTAENVYQVGPREHELFVDATKTYVQAVGASPTCCNIPNWNDAAGRTLGEVVSGFDKAILLAQVVAQRTPPIEAAIRQALTVESAPEPKVLVEV